MINLRGLKDLRFFFEFPFSAFFLNNKFQASVVFHWHFQPLYPPLEPLSCASFYDHFPISLDLR